jgi:hypothetical protein
MEGGLAGDAAAAAGVEGAPLAHDEAAADEAAPDEAAPDEAAPDEAAADDASAGRAEPTADGVGPAGADLPDPAPAADPAPAVDELDDVVAQPAARPAAASATMVGSTERQVINGISFVTFQLTLDRMARL